MFQCCSLNSSHPSLEVSYLALCYLEVFLLIYRYPGVFQEFFCLILLWSESMYFFLKICWCMFYDPRCYLSWWTFHVSLTRMYIPLLLGKVVYRCQLHPVGQWCYWVLLHPSGFLPARSIHFFFFFHPFLIVSNYESGFVGFSFQLYQFLPHVCWCPIVRHIHLKPWKLTLLSLWNVFIPDSFPYSEVCSVWN